MTAEQSQPQDTLPNRLRFYAGCGVAPEYRIKLDMSEAARALDGADRLADEVAALIACGFLGTRTAAADALLNYRQYLARFLISESLGYLPDPLTHIHHEDRDLRNDEPSNLSLVNVVYHGRIHASAAFVARAENGRFRELEPDQDARMGGIVKWPRDRAVLGNQALQGT